MALDISGKQKKQAGVPFKTQQARLTDDILILSHWKNFMSLILSDTRFNLFVIISRVKSNLTMRITEVKISELNYFKCITNSKRCMLTQVSQTESSEEQRLFTKTKACKSLFHPHSAVWRGIHRQLPVKISHCQGTYRLSIDNEAQCLGPLGSHCPNYTERPLSTLC